MAAQTSDNSRFPVGLTIAVAIAFAILIGLGVWQVRRLAWKTELLANVDRAKVAAAMPLSQALALSAPEYHRVEVDCPGLASAAFVEVHAIIDGNQGRRLISPCPATSGEILVDRGFISDDATARPPVAADPTPVRIVGVLRKGEHANAFTPPPSGNLFFTHDLAAIGRALGVAQPGGYFIAAETSSNPSLAALKPIALPSDIPNNHFSYALTWFGLAAGLLAIYAGKLMPWLQARFAPKIKP